MLQAQEWPTCIQSDIPFTDDALICNRRILRVTHGWLCKDHYREQQRDIPARPRKPRYLSIRQATDAEIVRGIIRADAELIAAGKVTSVTYGTVDPVTIRFLEVR